MPKISTLPVATTISDSVVFPGVQSGVTKQFSTDLILDSAEARTANTFGEGFHQPSTFYNNFTQHPTTPLKVWLTGFNNKAIYFRGQLDCSLVTFTPNLFIQAFRLPTNTRPTVILQFPVIGNYDAIGICSVHPDGYVYFKNLTGNLLDSGVIDLANVSYYIDPF